jgi:preprotein translocase subunit SecA
MTEFATRELWQIFDARRVKAPELKGLDAMANVLWGWFKNRQPVLSQLKALAARVDTYEPEVQKMGSAAFYEAVGEARDLARRDKLIGPSLDKALALAREACLRSVGMRPFPVQIMGAAAMIRGVIAEMATGEGKTLTAAVAASIIGLAGRPVHVITVNDYLVERDAEEMGPVYTYMGLTTGFITHETTVEGRVEHYRRNVVYCTSKELVADFLRDQIKLGTLRNSMQTTVGMMLGGDVGRQLQVPGLFRSIVDEADSLLIDEGVTPLIISNKPDYEGNRTYYQAACDLAVQLELDKDFTIDRTTRKCELTSRGHKTLDRVAEGTIFGKGKRRREELVTNALTGLHCYVRDEQYLVGEDGKVQIIDESTGRIMKDRSWQHGLHQAIEVKENAKITADAENLARLSFQRFFRQYPKMCGMTGTAWEAAPELWQIYQRPVIRIPTNRPCIRVQLPVRMVDTMEEKWAAVVDRVEELHGRGVPILIGTRSVLASEEVSKRLEAKGIVHRVLNATQTASEASIVADAGHMGKVTVATNMAGRGTDIKLAKGVAELGGLHVIATEPHSSHRVDRQLFGRAARQGDPGCAQMFACAEDDLFIRHANGIRKLWRTIGAQKLIKIAQGRAERMARFSRKQVLKNDDWMDQSLPF